MALNLSLLTIKAECDAVVADLDAELDTYQVRDTNLSYQDRQSTRSLSEVTAALAGVDAEIAAFTAILATPNLPEKLRKQNESKLRRAHDRRENLAERGTARTGAAAFLADVDAEQVAAQVAVLTQARAQVVAHKATLPS